MIMRLALALLIMLFYLPAYAECPKWVEAGYSCPSIGPEKDVWRKFYESDTEPAHVSILVAVGKKMAPYIAEAIKDKNMYLRRYAIGALGYLKDKKTIPVLRGIFDNSNELDYFRGDALESVYIIDQELGKSLASNVLKKQYPENSFVKLIANWIINDPKRIDLNWKIYYGP
jgi:hypothetical protein